MSFRTNTGVPLPQGVSEDPLTHYTRVFTRFLQLVFASFEKGEYQWSEDENHSDIIIQDQGTVNREAVERRPAIIVARGPVSFANIGLDQFKKFDFSEGKRTHTDLMGGNISYNCLAKEGLEAQKIAWVSAYATRALKRSLMRAGVHRVGEEIQIGAESPPGSIVQPDTEEVTMVSVNVPFHAQQTWSVEPIDKILLKGIDIAINSKLNYPDIGAKKIRSPGIYGKVLSYTKLITLNSGVRVRLYQTPTSRK